MRGERQLANLVQEQGAPGSRLERPLSEHVRAGEGAALVPEQLVFDQALRERAAVQGDERTVRSGAEAMQLPGDEFLSRSAFADDQHRARNLGDARDGVLEALHGRARAHQRGVGAGALAQGGDLTGEALARERVLDLLHHPLHRLGLVDEALGAEPDRLRAPIVVAGPGVHDHRDAQAASLHGAQHLEAVHPRHFEIEDDAVHGLALECIEGVLPAGRDQSIVPADPLQIVGVLLRHGGHVVDHEHGGHSPSPGSSTMNLLPAPGAVSTRSAPSASSTRRRTMERPRPVPSGLVV